MALNAVDQLCLQCGLCCDGTLFADVELRAGDDAKRLKKLGLPIAAKGKSKLAFPQSCACFDGKLCEIYEQRPKRCRQFACGLLKQVEAGRLDAVEALSTIHSARKQFEQVNALLVTMGQGNRALALTRRYAAAMSAPLDLADEANAEHYGGLLAAMEQLMQQLQQNFLS
jgi:hypothetical protein